MHLPGRGKKGTTWQVWKCCIISVNTLLLGSYNPVTHVSNPPGSLTYIYNN